MKKILIIAAAALGIYAIFFYSKHPLHPQVRIGNTVFNVELAVTPEEKQKGLGYRDSLKEGWGMLFPYDHKEQYAYWMKGMRFPIDIVWIDENTVADITYDLPIPTTEPLMQYQPRVPVDKILELNAGVASKSGIKIGDRVDFLTK